LPTAKARSASSKSKSARQNRNPPQKIAETIATSPLVKTAFAGGDPNWGRIFAAAGRSGVKFDPSLVEITMAGIKVLKRGQPLDFNERAASNKLLADHVRLLSPSRWPVLSEILDLRLHRRIRPHQRLLPHVNIHRVQSHRYARKLSSVFVGAAQMSKRLEGK